MSSKPPATNLNQNAITAVVCLALAAVVAAMASLNVALPSIARSTHADQTQLEWIVDAYSLVFASLLLFAGAIGDHYGRRRALLVGLSIFGGASALAMTAHSPNLLIGLRAVIGLGAALVMPATLSTITSTFPADKRARAVGLWAGVTGASAVLGVLVSGLLLVAFSWQAVFAVNVALALVAIVGTLRVVPESADPDAPRIDVGGAVIAVAGLVALVFSVIEAPAAGWLSAQTVVGITAGLLLLGGFLAWESRQAHPLLDPHVLRDRRLAAGSGSIFVQFFAYFGFIFIVLQYLQLVRGDTALFAAASMLPMSVSMLAMTRVAPRLTERFGARPVCTAGLALIAGGLLVLAQLSQTSAYTPMLVGLTLLGTGMGLAMTPATSGITEALPKAEQGVGSALNDLSRETGGALGIAVLGSVLTAAYHSHLQLPGLPAQVAEQARRSFAVAARIGGPTAMHANAAFIDGLHLALTFAAGAAGLAAILVALLLAPRRPSRPARRPGGARTRVAHASTPGGWWK
jgi:EmrB/QacA subfamily drug resistance transporter